MTPQDVVDQAGYRDSELALGLVGALLDFFADSRKPHFVRS